MSEKTKKTTKSHRKNSDNKNNNNVCLSSLWEPKQQKTVCFPEWADDEVNLQTKDGSSPAGKSKDKSKKKEKVEEVEEVFEDSQVLFLPSCFQEMVLEWKRPKEIFTDYQFVIYKDDISYSDLLNGSAHLVQSSFVRSFISNILNLEYLAKKTNFGQEATTYKYVPNATGYWKPWHHIYGTGKVGAHTVHNPQVNPTGRYCVRLFWLGAWRRVVVDDFLPLDATGHVLLPSFTIPKKSPIITPPVPSAGSKDKGKRKGQKADKEATQTPTVILWPFLLSKALLKVANLTMKNDMELLDFNITHSLTGWVLQEIKLKGLDFENVWEICKKHANVYAWSKEEETTNAPGEKKNEKKGEKKGSKKDKKGSKADKQTPKTSENSYCLIVLCSDLRFAKQNAVNGMSPCWGHEIVIDECRDIPLERPPPEPEYPHWKEFRWTEWAKSKGIITEYIPMDTTRYLKCFSPFKKFAKLVVYKEPEVEETPRFPLRKSVGMLMKPEIEAAMKHYQDVSDNKSKDKKKQPDLPPVDPTMWLQFEELCANLDSIFIFYKPTSFTHKARVSDLELNTIVQLKQKNASDTWQDLTWTNGINQRGNEPIYFFMDSLETKIILINLEQTGDQKRLLPLEDELSENNFFVEYEKLFGQHAKSEEEGAARPKKMKLDRARIHAGLKKSNIIFEEYRWDSAETGQAKFFLNTYGSSCSIMELEPGRHIYRVWIKSRYSYCMTMLSDTKFSLCCFERIMDNMVGEPMRMTRFALNVAYGFAMLVQNFPTPQFADRLHEYHRCYLPEDAINKLSKMERMVLHQAFQRSLQQYIEMKEEPETAQIITDALRALFIDKAFHVPREIEVIEWEPFQFQSYQERKICEDSATALQAFFKGVQVRKLLAKHNPSNKRSSEVFDVLKTLYTENFSLDKRDQNLGTIIRNFFQDENVSRFVDMYDFSKDFKWDVIIQTFVGSSEPNRGYVVLARFSLRCHKEVLLAIHLFCSVNNYILRIIDNDNSEEMYRFTSHVPPKTFKPNTFGYTVTTFAWCADMNSINWKLAVISSRNSSTFFVIEEIPTMTISAFENFVPLCEELIGKHLMLVKEDVIFTMRFSCSYEGLEFKMNLLDASGTLMMEQVGKEKIVVPAVLLRYCPVDEEVLEGGSISQVHHPSPLGSYSKLETRSSVDKATSKSSSRRNKENTSQMSVAEPQVYRLEFYVVDKSWPLTRREWLVVRKLREELYYLKPDPTKETVDESLTSISKGTTRTSRESKKNSTPKAHALERPWYLLQYSLRPKEHAVLIKNKEEEEKVLNMKQSWYEDDPERYIRSLELRHKYLERYSDPGCTCPEEFNICNSEDSMNKFADLSPQSSHLFGSRLEEEDDIERTNSCPRWTEAEIPKFDLTPYFKPQSEDSPNFGQRIVKTEEDHERDAMERQRMIEEYMENMQKNEEDMELWINESSERMTLTFLWYADIRRMSEEMYQDDHVTRKAYFDKWAAEIAPPKKEKAKKDKKSKKK